MSKAISEEHQKEVVRRLKTLLASNRYRKVQAKLAKDLGISAAYLSQTLNGKRRPGSTFWDMFRRIPGINPVWIADERAKPFAEFVPESTSQPIPVVDAIPSDWPPSPPTERSETISAGCGRLNEMFWLEIGRRLAAGRICRRVGVREDDLLLFTTARNLFLASPEFDSTLCVVPDRWSKSGSSTLGFVSFETDVETGGEWLEADTFDPIDGRPDGVRAVVEFNGSGLTLRRDRSKLAAPRRPTPRELARRSPSRIERADIIAVWTGLLKRGPHIGQ
jgi:hypothetical protein